MYPDSFAGLRVSVSSEAEAEDSDDAYLTDDGIIAQTPGYTPVLKGFIRCCDMYRRTSSSRISSLPRLISVAAQLLERRRDYMVQSSSPGRLPVIIRDVEDIWYCINNLLTTCPKELQVDLEVTALEESLMAGLEPSELRESQLATTLPTFPAIGQVSEKSYQAQQANLFVTKVSLGNDWAKVSNSYA